jgi:hypothetical protein
MKTMKEEEVGARSLAHNIFGVKGACWNSRMGIRTNDKHVNYSYQFAQTKQQIA